MILVNGEYKEEIPVSDRGLQYGDGLFETIEVRAGQPMFLQQHLDRLLNGCRRLYIPAPSPEFIKVEINQALKQFATHSTERGDCILKIIVTRGSGGRGYRQPERIEPTRIISLHPYPDYPAELPKHGIHARICQTRLALNPLLAGLKHLNRLEQVIARAEWDDPTIQEGIMMDFNGHVIEGTASNVFFVKARTLHTPLLSHSGIAGIIRSIVIGLANKYQIGICEHLFGSELLMAADEIFVTNSIIGIWPVRQIGTYNFPVGPTTQLLQNGLEQLKRDLY